MIQRIALLSFALLSFAAVGCTVQTGEESPTDPEATPSQAALSMSPSQAADVLALVNYPATDAALLDHEVGLDSRAATNIAKFRAGSDGLMPTADDAYFADLGALDAIPFVGDAAFQKLESYSAAHPSPQPESVEGVLFRGWEAETVIWAVNHLTPAALDAVLDVRAVDGLVAIRPFASVTAMGPSSYVGASALESLRNAATGWWGQMAAGSTESLAGTFDGVSFDETTAETALAVANGATVAELTAHGMTSSPATTLVSNRPFATLEAVAATKGIGEASMQALHDYAASGQWGVEPGSNSCIEAFESAVAPHLDDLLLMSESDREINVVSFPGAGASAPTPESVLALVKKHPGDTVENRTVENFFVVLEPSSDSADPGAAAALQSIVTSQLSDVIYVKIHAPESDPYHAEVNVYLVGRTTCGDLVALHAIAIET